MRRTLKRKIYTGILFFLFIGASFQVSAENQDWIETFDKESDISHWLVAYGGWNISDGVLKTISCESVSVDNCFDSIWHDSPKVTGTWSFEILQPENDSHGSLFYFMGWGQASVQYVNFHPANGYVIRVYANGNIDLDYIKDGVYQFSPGIYRPTEQANGWKNIEVSRNKTGWMEVRLNGTNIINATHNLITKSESINIQAFSTGAIFDNVGYKENIIIGGTEQTSAPTPNFELIPTLVFLPIISFLVLRKRKKSRKL